MEGTHVSPGLCQSMISTLGKKVQENPAVYGHVALMIDAMAIRKKISRDSKSQSLTGFVDLGDGSESDIPAKEALVIMVVGLQGHWKAPIAYYFTNVLTAAVQAQLIQHALEALSEEGIRVWSLTMDGHSTNLAMCRELGCALQDAKPYFPHPQTEENVYIIFDTCHMLKLVRNLLGDYSIIQSPDGFVRWQYISNLQDLQEQAGLRLANKLSSKHLNFHKMKMKVNLAAQTLSSSVASALDCLKTAGHVKFAGCEATVKFLKVSYTKIYQ